MTETKLTGKTPDIAEENIAKLKEVFPDVFCEGKIDFEKLQQVLGNYVEDENERYNFSWNGKGRSLRLAQCPSTGTLRPCKEESKNWDTTENLYIEGDNLEVLKLLQKSYHSKIKMIYIDPPYNTGHDFVYHDDYKDNMQNYLEITGQTDDAGKRITTNPDTSGRYHTDWLNMMYPRLRLARNLLTNDGVIFISIDDNEVTNLRKICDEVFGEENYMNQLAWVVNITGRQISGHGAAKTWESILVYAKNIEYASSLNVNINFAKNKMPDSYKSFNKEVQTDKIGAYTIGDTLYNHNRKFNEKTRPNLVFSIFYNPSTEEIITGDIGEYKDGFIELLPHTNGDGVHKYHAWRWSKQKIENESYNLIVLPTSKGGYEIYTRIRDFNTTLLKDIITNISNGDSEVQKLFEGKKYFEYPKSIDLLKLLIDSLTTKNAIVLDFFSGSATTAHAVMELNAEDGGKRKFICVQLPEPTDEKSEAYKAGYKNICEIGKERIRRAGEKINEEIAENNKQISIDGKEKELVDIGFKVFKLDTSNIKRWNPDFDNLELSLLDSVDNLTEGRTEIDLVYEIMLKYGIDLTYPVEEISCGDKKIYAIGFGMLVICVAESVSTDVAEFIMNYKKQNDIEEMRVVFKDSSFKNDSTKTNIKEILKRAGIEEFITI